MAKKNKAPTLPVGRPTEYRQCHNKMAYKLCLLGATNEQLADFFNVSVATISNWMNEHRYFLEAIKRGKIQADAEIAEALYHRAKGYSHPDVHISNYQGEITITDITKQYPPDTAAAFIWLKNRAGWRDESQLQISDNRLSKEEIERIRNHLRTRYIESTSRAD